VTLTRVVVTVIRRSTGYIVAAAVARAAAGWTSSASVVPMTVLGQCWLRPGEPR
jgi:hypothetical protein